MLNLMNNFVTYVTLTKFPLMMPCSIRIILYIVLFFLDLVFFFHILSYEKNAKILVLTFVCYINLGVFSMYLLQVFFQFAKTLCTNVHVLVYALFSMSSITTEQSGEVIKFPRSHKWLSLEFDYKLQYGYV